MKDRDRIGHSTFRVWIAEYDRWTPTGCGDVPPVATALEPAEEGLMPGFQAMAYVEAFNREVLHQPRKIWAVALPASVCYCGDPQPGQPIRPALAGCAHKKSPPRAR